MLAVYDIDENVLYLINPNQKQHNNEQQKKQMYACINRRWLIQVSITSPVNVS